MGISADNLRQMLEVTKPLRYTTTVKVMRSYDYNNFEISISADNLTIDEINELRKTAARLVDNAVYQFEQKRKRDEENEIRVFKQQNRREQLKRYVASDDPDITAIESIESDIADNEPLPEYGYDDDLPF